ncbi:MAG: phosphonopyruvate decarboxylase [Lachnospiraceae bacterium]|nr:phosphonopyruvate decarboxylase [Lachnospiraceae bacterium]
MKAETLLRIIGADFYTGVPDSQLKSLCDELMARYGTDPRHHIIGANEGNCAALAAGYHLATGKLPVVYLQNSGEGNIINPVASLLNPEVYGIPVLFIIGWRGEPGVHDEPQHVYQGQITTSLLDQMAIEWAVIAKDTEENEVQEAMDRFRKAFSEGRQAAFVIRKGALTTEASLKYENEHLMTREDLIRRIAEFTGTDPVVSTTGKASRELYEIREAQGAGHGYDFLTVGSMGHASSIALGIALQKPEKRVWCIDGDGACLMHMGAMAVMGAAAPENLIHIVINNEAHETVGGMPTAAGHASLTEVALACGYQKVRKAETPEELTKALQEAKEGRGLFFLEAKCAIGARADLGRPKTTPAENKIAFMKELET